MLCEADIQVSWRARPRGFVALMSLYESNYLRFLHLAGDPTRLSGTLVSRVDGDCELRLSVLEHMPYTSRLRAYHDARLLEADQFRQQQPKEHNTRRQDPRKGERELHQRWTRNMMLNKWLEYCVGRGHRFTT